MKQHVKDALTMFCNQQLSQLLRIGVGDVTNCTTEAPEYLKHARLESAIEDWAKAIQEIDSIK